VTIRAQAARKGAHPWGEKEAGMARLLVMIPSGEIYDHDCVRWYQYQNIQRSIDNYHNIGDAFVFDSSLKLLNFEKVGVLEINNPDWASLDRLREEYDYVMLRGSNYVHGEMQWHDTAAVLRKLGLPVLAFGIGAQAPVRGRLELSDQTVEVLRTMAELSTSIGVRGAFSAQVLSDLGIDNVRIIGCPTAFRKLDPDLRITLPPLADVEKVGLTIRREVSPTYAQDIQRYLTFHRDLVKTLAGRFDTTLMAQGEVEEKKIVLGTDAQKEEAIAALRANGWAAQWYFDDAMEALYRERLFYSDVVADYEALVRRMDLVLGYRLHGNLMALANGVPSIYVTYDSRTAEFAETYRIPSYDVFGDAAFVLEDYWDQGRFDTFNAAWRGVYDETRAFLLENNVDTRLVARTGETRRADMLQVA
jgi:hypothetical protein